MRYCKLLFLPLLLVAFTVHAQKSSPIVTDRPDQSDGAYVLPKRLLQLENGILFNREGVLNNFMVRYGWSENSEIRFAMDFGKFNSDFTILPSQFSVKHKILNQTGAIPTITLIGYLNVGQLASSNVDMRQTKGSLLLAFQYEINDKMGFEWNFGSQSFKNDLRFTFLYSCSIFENVTTFIEYFADYSTSTKPFHNVDLGILYTATNDFNLDIGIGRTLYSSSKSLFFTVGASHRFRTAQ
jgi:hypothetical protein